MELVDESLAVAQLSKEFLAFHRANRRVFITSLGGLTFAVLREVKPDELLQLLLCLALVSLLDAEGQSELLRRQPKRILICLTIFNAVDLKAGRVVQGEEELDEFANDEESHNDHGDD